MKSIGEELDERDNGRGLADGGRMSEEEVPAALVRIEIAEQVCVPGPEEVKVPRPVTPPPPEMHPVDPGARFKAPKGKHGLPLNIPLSLDDGRTLLVRRGTGQTMVCLQIGKKDENPGILREGDTVATVAGRDGRKAVLHVEKRTRKDVHFRILGSVDDRGNEKA